MTSSRQITIRICVDSGAVDWTVLNPEMVTFSASLGVISQVLPDVTVSAFEWIDEDGDRITVRTDDEMKLMLSSYIGSLAALGGMPSAPLMIYPKVFKGAGQRNIHGLKIQTKDTSVSGPALASNGPAATVAEEMEQDSSRKRSGNIQEILACGNIHGSDLHYVQVLGSGNCGTVYRAIQTPANTVMAVKVILLDISQDKQKQIISELEILYQCHSPVIISFFGAFFLENRISICTEYMDGGSLDRYKQIPEHILGPISVSVVRGLQYLWSLRIMHRDVKPSNILVNTEGQVKLCDFGVSVQLLDSIAKTFIGTNAYMAPERIKGEQYSIHSEVWSLGVSLFEMAAGNFPYESARTPASKTIDLLKSIVDRIPPQLPRGVFSDSFVDFVSKCMQKSPLLRPAPEALMRLPFIERYKDSSSQVVAEWVQHYLNSLRVKQQQAG